MLPRVQDLQDRRRRRLARDMHDEQDNVDRVSDALVDYRERAQSDRERGRQPRDGESYDADGNIRPVPPCVPPPADGGGE